MKLDKLKMKVRRDAIIMSVIIFFSFLIVIFSWMKDSDMDSDYNSLRKDNLIAMNDYSRIKQTYEKSLKEIVDYKNIKPEKLPSKVVDTDIPTIIRESRAQLLRLKNLYHIETLDMSISPLVEASSSEYKKDTISAVSTLVTLKYEAPSDELIYSFIDSLIDEFPGYIRIESFEMKRDGDITDRFLKEIVSKRGFPTSGLVSGMIVFEWVKLKEIQQDNKPAS